MAPIRWLLLLPGMAHLPSMKTYAEFLQEVTAQATINGYNSAMYSLITAIYGNMKVSEDRVYSPEEKRVYLEKIEEYLQEKRNYYADLIQLKKHIQMKAPRTQRSYLYAVKNVLEICADYTFTKSQEKSFKASLLKGTRKPISQSDQLTHDMIRSIVAHSNIPTKAAILTMATSGIRVGELIQLEIKHFDLTRRRILIPAYIAKTREQRYVYFTTECKNAIEVWLKYRQKYMEDNVKSCTTFKPKYRANEPRMFPMSDRSLRENVEIGVKNAGYLVIDPTTRRMTISPYSFRKWFSTLASASLSHNVGEILMGHELPYGGAYVKLSDNDIEKTYRQHENDFLIGTDEVIRNTITKIDSDMDMLMRENATLKKDMENMKKVLSEMLIQKMIMEDKPLPRVEGEENIKISS